ncbi:hypothetical protein BDP81DRAFT_463010 [Colletotrichum phormii]|uniref:DUF8212 domain-containing protein n=1 Tax=Colletotrichum phormii TaxID=359342 RepID=A0AAI9ZLG9_9PEZI|nr:uncharacterized protein BDP81DRAFT_463010 [Colletotrichum phormii]KAK1633876.1 hypothetical protein BDP81DRAFT_463010 [Colletotrichum phormii]
MWLINVNTLELEDFIEPDFPYAILSHTWGSQEALSIQCPAGTTDHGSVCFAFLSDVNDLASSATFLENLAASRWFTRGWTLQELIAPKTITFYNASWQLLGSKETLSPFLSSITGIDEAILIGKAPLLKVPVATRMSWASKRQTTRTEDSAYCLLGIFDINMPLLYGEGEKAFARLQSEILQDTNDLSILAWTSTLWNCKVPDSRTRYSSLLTPGPWAGIQSRSSRQNLKRFGMG